MSGRLEGKRCLIVGGTTGIGFAAACRFLEEGARLAVTGLDEQRSRDGVVALEQYGKVWSASWDGHDRDQFQEAFNSSRMILDGLDVLFHVAGGSGRKLGDGPLHECTDAGWEATLDANLRSTFLTNRAAVQHFLGQRQAGAILNMASVLAFSPAPRHFDTIAYAAAKAGIIAVSRLAAARYGPDGIRVNVIAPGLIDTPMSVRACSDPAIQAYLRTKQPLRGGPGQPEDCSDAAVFLCSDAARIVTGVVLPVDGGWSVSEGQYV
ncbi:MAG TPA: SDR family NAD(P)-dependent oxidoreductase [Gemmataceae bacterium]|nr:SDR family NAD(P)-dependent oxidoreductase [Gemmataceae bacterium]